MKQYISELLSQAVEEISPNEGAQIIATSTFDVSAPKPGFGDYASNAAMVLFKQFEKAPASNPPALAAMLAEVCKKHDHQQTFSSIESAAGFINFTLSPEFLDRKLYEVIEQGDAYGSSNFGENQTVIIEYFQNNIAKPPHVGHLRSAVVGDALMRIFRFAGFKAISDTHVGDWGTQFGILLYAYKTMGDKTLVEKDPVVELNKLYVAMSAKIETEPALRDNGKAEFKKLEQGNAENRALWQWFIEVSLADFERYRILLGLLPFDLNLGESFYEDKMAAVLAELTSKDLVQTGETGELYVDLEEQGLGRCILVKSDGATTYHLRDFATYKYRKDEFNFYRNTYVVDNRQSHHFAQLFRIMEMAGYPAETDSVHIDLGFMSLPEGPISTRKGTIISLENLVAEAEKRSLAIIEQKNPELPNKQVIASQVARAAIKYFDLSHNRRTEFVFTWDKALSFEGNTGPYLQYAHARIYGILRKVGTTVKEHGSTEMVALQAQELAVLRKLNAFPEILERVTEEYLPNYLCQYLFELSQTLNTFYEACPVSQEPDEQIKQQRIALVTATAQIIKNGLRLLGIDAPEEM